MDNDTAAMVSIFLSSQNLIILSTYLLYPFISMYVSSTKYVLFT